MTAAKLAFVFFLILFFVITTAFFYLSTAATARWPKTLIEKRDATSLSCKRHLLAQSRNSARISHNILSLYAPSAADS